MPHSLLAEFAEPEALMLAAARLRALGYERLDAHAPFAIPGIEAALGLAPSRMPLVMLLGGLAGGAIGYALQWWTTAIAYPLRVGGMPLHSLPAFIPITFESAVLGACVCGAVATLARNGLPRLWHPCFEVEGFERASRDRFFLSIPLDDTRADAASAELRACGAIAVHPTPEDGP